MHESTCFESLVATFIASRKNRRRKKPRKLAADKAYSTGCIRDWIKQHIRWEFYYRAFGKTAAERSKWAEDAEVLKAVENLPRAQALMSQAQKTYAMQK